jgi:hypothetical protein
MVVAMVPMRMVKVIAHQVIGVIAMWYGLMPAALTMTVIVAMRSAAVLGGTVGRVGAVHRQFMLVDMITVRVMHVAIVEVIGVTVVNHRDVPTIGAVLMVVVLVRVMCHVPTSPVRETFFALSRPAATTVLEFQAGARSDKGLRASS